MGDVRRPHILSLSLCRSRCKTNPSSVANALKIRLHVRHVVVKPHSVCFHCPSLCLLLVASLAPRHVSHLSLDLFYFDTSLVVVQLLPPPLVRIARIVVAVQSSNKITASERDQAAGCHQKAITRISTLTSSHLLSIPDRKSKYPTQRARRLHD